MDCKKVCNVKLGLTFLILVFFSNCEGKNHTANWYEDFKGIVQKGLLKQIAKGIIVEDSGNKVECVLDLKKWSEDIPSFKRWALEMLDAGGRLPYGLLKGNINSLGQYDECVAISHKREDSSRTIKGKYCLARIPVPSGIISTEGFSVKPNIVGVPNQRFMNMDDFGDIVFSLAICMPASCKSSDVDFVLKSIFNPYNISVSLPWEYCNTNDIIPWSAGDITALVIMIFFVCLLLASTAYDLWFKTFNEDEAKTQSVLLTSFSMYTNSKRLITLSKDPGPLACIHGIRILSLLWIIWGHRNGVSLIFPMDNHVELIEWTKTYGSTSLMSASLAVDTFFLLSGLLISYIFFRNPENKSFRDIPMFYLHRILRLTPALMMVALLQATLMARIGSGPLWKQFNWDMIDPCREYWWSTLLYIQNYVNSDFMCLLHTWYLSIDMQLYILSPILLIPLLKHKKFGLAWAVAWTLASQITIFVLCYQNAWYAAFMTSKDPNGGTRGDFYHGTFTRATPWLIGIIAGYLLRVCDLTKITINKMIVAIGWIVSLAAMLGMVVVMKPLQDSSHEFSYWEDTTYMAFSKTVWILGILWVICACAFGYGGPVNWFLSLRLWEFLARLSYSMYLIHICLQSLMVACENTVGSFSLTRTFHLFLGDVVMTIVISYFMVLAFESPVTVLEKLIFKTDKKKPVPQENLGFEREQDKTVPMEQNISTLNEII